MENQSSGQHKAYHTGELTMDISPSDNRQEIPTAGLPPGESSPGQSSGDSVGSPRVTSHIFTPESERTVTAMEPPPECRRSPRKHPRSEQEDEIAGYDSDDGPCFDAIFTEGVQDFGENDVIAPSNPPCTKEVHQDGSFAFALSCHGSF